MYGEEKIKRGERSKQNSSNSKDISETTRIISLNVSLKENVRIKTKEFVRVRVRVDYDCFIIFSL